MRPRSPSTSYCLGTRRASLWELADLGWGRVSKRKFPSLNAAPANLRADFVTSSLTPASTPAASETPQRGDVQPRGHGRRNHDPYRMIILRATARRRKRLRRYCGIGSGYRQEGLSILQCPGPVGHNPPTGPARWLMTAEAPHWRGTRVLCTGGRVASRCGTRGRCQAI